MKYSVNDFNAKNEKKNDYTELFKTVSVIEEISKKLSDCIKDQLPQNDIPKSMKLILLCLIKKDGVTQLDIVKYTKFKAPTISITIHKMEEEGLVRREPDKCDLRAMRVFITEKGKKVYTESANACKNLINKVLKNLSSDEIEALNSSLAKIKSNLDEIEE